MPTAQGVHQLQENLIQRFNRQLAEILDKHCSALSHPNEIHRIETLELDLGEIPLDTLEETLSSTFGDAFHRSLAKAISKAKAGHEVKASSRLELIGYFAETGTLPWWADPTAPGLLDEAVAWLSNHAPAQLRALTTDLVKREPQRKRLIGHLSDDSLLALSGFTPPLYEDLSTLLHKTNGGHSPQRLRQVLWEAILLGDRQPDFLQPLLLQLAVRSGVRYTELLSDMLEAGQRLIQTKHPFQSNLPALLAALQADEPVAQAPAAPKPAPPAEKTPLDYTFSVADEASVGNAGLVLLWPFLPPFFQRLDLLEDTHFKDEAAQHRAVGLLQHLADGALEPPPEYLLPLCKLLCGMAPEEVFDFGPPLTAAEIAECETLLEAVIAHAPILNEMSISAFRGTFLLRQGQLSTREGAWLLRVEGATYDVVLDRFPWSAHTVKLPWMGAVMQVEW